MTLIDQAKNLQKEIVDTRRYLHAHPELSFQENETAKFAGDHLDKLGYQVKHGLAKTGVVANLGKENGVTVAIRADMDALPIEESITHSHCSQNKGVMHACGHDAHIACALAAAKLLIDPLSKNQGKVRFLLQPAEECADSQGHTGAYRMIEDGALDKVSAIIGLHMDASLPAGKIGIAAGPVMAASDALKIIIKGKGGHGAFPENAIDPVVIGALVVQAIQQIVSRRISAVESAIITIGSFQSSSTRGNVISDHVLLEGTIRTFNKDVRKLVFAEIEKACALARNFGGDYHIEYPYSYPATINDPQVTAIMQQAAIDLIGKENVIELPAKLWSEDFSRYQEQVPGAFMFLGCEIAGNRRAHHSGNFDMDESGLYKGSAILAETAQRLLTHLAAE